MQRLFTRIVFFSLFLLICTSLFNAANFHFQKSLNERQQLDVELAIIGHSHARAAINDTIVSNILNIKTQNYGVGGQGPFWTTQVAEKVIQKGVRNIIINFTNNSLTTEWKSFDNLRASREYYLKGQLSLNDWSYLLGEDLFFALKLFFRGEFANSNIHGGYKALTDTFKPQTVVGNQINSPTQYRFNVYALNQLIQKHKDVNFIFIRIPTHPSAKRNNEEEFQHFMSRLQKQTNVVTFDFDSALDSDSSFADLGHLNHHGAEKFSHLLASSIFDALKRH